MAQRPEKKNSAKAKNTGAAKKSAAVKKKAKAKTEITTQKKVEKVEKPVVKTETSTKKVTKPASTPANKKRNSAPKKTAQRETAKQSSNKKTERYTMNNKNFDKFANDAADAGRKQIEALSKSGSIFWKGCEDILRECMSLAQDSTDKNSKMIQTLMSTKNMQEWAETSNKMTQQSFDNVMAGLTKISEMGVKIATDSFEPINDQVNKAVKKASEAMAA